MRTFVQARTRSRIGSSKSVLSDGGCSRRSVCGAVADRRRVGGVALPIRKRLQNLQVVIARAQPSMRAAPDHFSLESSPTLR